MIRKVIKQGNNTLTITLPRDWTVQYGIKPGDELEIEEKYKELVLHAGKQRAFSRIELDVTGMDASSIVLLIRGLYRRGYDFITIKTKDQFAKHIRADLVKKMETVIHSEANRLMGFELFDHTKNSYEMRSFSGEPLEDFDVSLRKIFLKTMQFYDDFVVALEKNDRQNIEAFIERPETITKFISYASRIINKKGYPKQEYTAFIYDLIESLEMINNSIENAVRFTVKHDIKVSSDGLKIIKKIGDLLRFYYESYYNFDLKKFSTYVHRRDMLLIEINDNFKKFKKEDVAIILQLRMILDFIRESLRIRASLVEID